MVMVFFANLDEEDFSSKMINDGLPATEMPPFDGVVQLAAGDDNPIRDINARDLLDERRHALFGIR